MKIRITHFLAAFALAIVAPAVAPVSAQAEVMVSGKGGFCFDVNASNGQVALWSCHGAANQNFFTSSYGAQTFNGQCIEASGKGTQLHLAACNGRPAQKWGLQASGELKNEEGWCADIPNNQAFQGQKVATWDCNGGANQKFGRGAFGRAPAAAVSSAAPGLAFNPSGARIGANGIVAGGGGNIVAAGGGNIVAAGGGNIVAAGGGNMVTLSGGSIVAAGGGN